MEAMNVSWLVLAEGEVIKFEFWRGQWVIKHSNCLIFLISGQENNCMRVAELESVLNYSPKH
jgi:competence protein ComEC